MATRWLFKTEPSAYSFQQLEKDKKTVWDGVKNNLALKNLKEIKKGDEILIYHAGDEKGISDDEPDVGHGRKRRDAAEGLKVDERRLPQHETGQGRPIHPFHEVQQPSGLPHGARHDGIDGAAAL